MIFLKMCKLIKQSFPLYPIFMCDQVQFQMQSEINSLRRTDFNI